MIPVRPLTWTDARRRLGVTPREFGRLVRAGVFHRVGKRFDPASLNANHARAIEIDRQAEAMIATVRRDAARRLAELGASQPERKPLA